MTTNIALLAEITISGIQSGVWLAFVVSAIFGDGWITTIVSELDATGVAVAIAFLYPLGLMVDRLADRLLRSSDRKIRAQVAGSESADLLGTWRLEVIAANPELAKDLAFARSRGRIARATMLNLLLLIPSGISYVVSQGARFDADDWLRVLLLSILATALAGVSYFSWRTTAEAQYTQLTRMHSLLATGDPRDHLGVRPAE